MTEINLSVEIAAFLKEKPRLIREHGPAWIVFIGEEFKGAFKDFADAASFATARFPRDVFLIRHTETTEPQFPFLVAGNF